MNITKHYIGCSHKSTKRLHFLSYMTLIIPHAFNHRHRSGTVSAFSTSPSRDSMNNKIFCFGDSLTAGTSPPSFQEHPYSSHLESKLNSITSVEEEQQKNKYLVRHFGLPGWTATQLSSPEGNLQSTLERINTSTNTYPRLVIILAGTNDLAYCTNSDECDDIFNSIKSIHDICHERNIDTVALSIPTSGYQSQSGNNASSFAKLINNKIESWATERRTVNASTDANNQNIGPIQPLVHYIPFPITEYDAASGFWSPDGLHFSPEGYSFIGESLAPIVKHILDSEKM